MTHKLLDIPGIKDVEKAFSWLKKWRAKPDYPEYFNARTMDEAVSLLNAYENGAKIMAGGLDVLGLMKNRVLVPETLINIKNIPGLRHITETDAGLEIGALTRINDIERSRLIQEKHLILSEAARAIGSPQIRNMGTVAGNLCQEVRCWYYRRSPATGITYDCHRKSENGVCYAADGENQYHAIFGDGACRAVCPSDLATVMLALDARIETVDASGGRSIPLTKFYGKTGNILAPGEIIKTVQVPRLIPSISQRFLKFRVRNAIDFAIVSVATVLILDNNIIKDARVVLGGVAPAPYRAFEAEVALRGEFLTESVAEKAAQASVSGASPLSKNKYKIPIIQALVKRAILGQN